MKSVFLVISRTIHYYYLFEQLWEYMETNLFVICFTNLLVVVVLLGIMAGIIHLLTRLFPDRNAPQDPGIASAIQKAVANTWPGTKVVRIEEIRPRKG